MQKEKRYSDWEYDEDIETDEQPEEDSSGDEGEGGAPEKKPEKVKLDDGTEVDIDELKKGYMRQSDYTKKTQELASKSKSEQQAELDKAKQVVENKDEYPEEDVKAAEYFIQIAKDKFGLMTKQEFDEIKRADENKTRLDNQLQEVSELSEKYGVKAPDKEELISYMKENQVYNAVTAFKAMKEDDIFEARLKKTKEGKKSYDTEKKGEKYGKGKKDKKKMSMDEYLDSELEEMDMESSNM